jgi:hypothetical protein
LKPSGHMLKVFCNLWDPTNSAFVITLDYYGFYIPLVFFCYFCNFHFLSCYVICGKFEIILVDFFFLWFDSP